jgi:hypothetical protein
MKVSGHLTLNFRLSWLLVPAGGIDRASGVAGYRFL